MNLKIVKRAFTEVETDLELPVYLYFQDELGMDELVKITEQEKITIKYSYHSLTILVENNFIVEEWSIKNSLTNEEHFNQVYLEALKELSDSVKMVEINKKKDYGNSHN